MSYYLLHLAHKMFNLQSQHLKFVLAAVPPPTPIPKLTLPQSDREMSYCLLCLANKVFNLQCRRLKLALAAVLSPSILSTTVSQTER